MRKNLIRFISLSIAIFFVLSFSACGTRDAAAYSYYQKASIGMKEATSIGANYEVLITIEDSLEESSFSGPTKVVSNDDGSVEILMDLNVKMEGEEFPLEMYYSDGFAYISTLDDMKFKQPMDMAQASEQAKMGTVEFEEDQITNQTVEKIDEGRVLSFTIDGASNREIIEGSIGSMSSFLGDQAYEYSDLTIITTVDDEDNFTSISLTADFIIQDGSSKKGTFKLLMTDIETDGVKIEPPSDLGSYPDITQPDEVEPAVNSEE